MMPDRLGRWTVVILFGETQMELTADMNDMAKIDGPASLEILRARARALVPLVRERAQAAERAGRLDDDVFAKMVEAGFGRICVPRRFGGYGLGLDVAAEVVMEMARGCGSAGWISNLMSIHNFQAGMFPLETQEEYFAGGIPFCATVSRDVGSKVTEIDGGVRLSGRWKYASGSHFAQWFIVMRPSSGFADWLMLPASDVSLQEDWEVSGLKATGSQDIVVEDVFVPERRRLSFAAIMGGCTPGRALYDDPFLRVPFLLPAAIGLSAAIVGMVTGMVEEFERVTPTRKTLTGGLPAAMGSNQAKLAQAEVHLECARHLVRGAAARVRGWGEHGVPEDLSELMIPRRDYAFAAKLMGETAQQLFAASGAGAAFLSNPIQRLARDAFVASTHLGLNWDDAAESYGRARWKIPAPA